jgi:hypothetical protein
MTPGMSPREAMFLKQILQIPNFLKKALLLPQIGHLLYRREENLGVLCAFAIKAFLAKTTPFSPPKEQTHPLKQKPRFCIRLCGSDNSDIETFYFVNLVIVYLREDDLLLDAKGVITPSIKGFIR